MSVPPRPGVLSVRLVLNNAEVIVQSTESGFARIFDILTNRIEISVTLWVLSEGDTLAVVQYESYQG